MNQAPTHGHVFPREDGTKADCGGPRRCDTCRADLFDVWERGQHAKSSLENQYTDPTNVLASLLEAMKGQLLIILVNRLGGKVEIPVAEVDATGQWMMGMQVDQAAGAFLFETKKKS